MREHKGFTYNLEQCLLCNEQVAVYLEEGFSIAQRRRGVYVELIRWFFILRKERRLTYFWEKGLLYVDRVNVLVRDYCTGERVLILRRVYYTEWGYMRRFYNTEMMFSS